MNHTNDPVRKTNEIIEQYRFKLHKNCVLTNNNESPEHLDLTWKVCKKIASLGLDYYCQPVIVNGKRPDIIIPKWFTAVEIVVSESDESIEEKKKSYLGLKIITIKSEEDILTQFGK